MISWWVCPVCEESEMIEDKNYAGEHICRPTPEQINNYAIEISKDLFGRKYIRYKFRIEEMLKEYYGVNETNSH